MLPRPRAALAALLASAPLAAQVPPAVPYPRTLDLLVVDSAYDGVWRLSDLNQDGDYNDAGEISSYYSDLVGSIAVTSPTAIACAPDGAAYFLDTSTDSVIWLRDGNGDGDANDPGEHRVFFDPSNASGIAMPTPQGVTVDALGRVFVAAGNASTPVSVDQILQLVDGNGDGDALDAGEARQYCVIPVGSSAIGASNPTKVVAAPDADLYYTDIGTGTGGVPKGVYRLADLNLDNDCNDPGEVSFFWTPPAASSPFFFGLAVDTAGVFYLSDHSDNESIWRAGDANASGTIDPGEETLFFQTTGSLWWDIVLRDDGVVLVCEDEAPDRITGLRDLDNDGDALDAGESFDAYNASVASVAVQPRGAALLRAPLLDVNPAFVNLGQSTTVNVRAVKPGDLVFTAISVGFIPPVSLPPFGYLEVDPNFAGIGLGLANAAGEFPVVLPIPNIPTALNTYALQALSGDTFRLYLSNAATLIVQ